MKNIIILLTTILLSATSVNSEENKKKLPDDCYAEYKVSPNTLGCKLKKGFKNLYTKYKNSRRSQFGYF